MDLICAGEMLIDFTPAKEPYTYTANPGGAPANVAIAAARNNIDTAFLGILGNDDFGKRLKGVLEKDNVRVLCEKLTDEAVTTLAFVTLYEGGERSFTFARKPGADILLSKDDVKESDIKECRIFHAGSVSLSDEPSKGAIIHAIKMAHDMGKLVSFDINYREMIWHDKQKCKNIVDEILPYIDLLKISDEEEFFVGDIENIASFMEKYNIKVVVETLGDRGAKYFYDKKTEYVESKKVKAVDATGAGDAFWGGFLSKLLMLGINKSDEITDTTVREALIYGNTAGGLCVQKMGGIPALPTKEEIEGLI